MSCNNCFNQCTEITPDKCVRYTGADISALGIQNGDTLLSVEQKLITYLLSALDGSGIAPAIEPSDVCTLVDGYLGAGTNLVDIVTALIKSICDLQAQVTSVTNDMTTLNANYDVDCLDGVSNSSDTHLVVQAIIDKLCAVVTDLQALSTDLSTNYVALADLNDLIQAYLDSTSTSLIKNRMVPYTAVEYYGPLDNFNAEGAGIGDWIEIYLCNGAHGTPDKRGRVAVGATSTPGTIPMSSVVDPNVAGNPTYTVGDVAHGANTITLSEAQMPQHTHNTVTSILNDPGHYHFSFTQSSLDGTLSALTYPTSEKLSGSDSQYNIQGISSAATIGKTSSSTTGIELETSTPMTGGSEAHSNIQPSIGCYYIMYVPTT